MACILPRGNFTTFLDSFSLLTYSAISALVFSARRIILPSLKVISDLEPAFVLIISFSKTRSPCFAIMAGSLPPLSISTAPSMAVIFPTSAAIATGTIENTNRLIKRLIASGPRRPFFIAAPLLKIYIPIQQ
jgi:hypothetical protein